MVCVCVCLISSVRVRCMWMKEYDKCVVKFVVTRPNDGWSSVAQPSEYLSAKATRKNWFQLRSSQQAITCGRQGNGQTPWNMSCMRWWEEKREWSDGPVNYPRSCHLPHPRFDRFACSKWIWKKWRKIRWYGGSTAVLYWTPSLAQPPTPWNFFLSESADHLGEMEAVN